MATITGSAAGGAWNTTAAWVGAVVPTAADDVLLTATSGPISLPAATSVACRSLDCTGYTSTLTWAATNSILNVGSATGGNVKFVSTMTLTRTGIGNLTLVGSAASTTYTLTTAGLVMPNIVCSAGASTTYQFADNVTATGAQIFITSGTLDTTGKTISAGLFASSGTTARTLTLGASAITLSQAVTFWSFATVTNLTMTANTAVVTATSSTTPTFAGGMNWNGMSLVIPGVGGNGAKITGVNTFANLTVTGTVVIDAIIQMAADQTITGTLTLTGNATGNRLWVQSDVPGTARTLTVNTTVTASRVDFEDIVGAGTASWNLSGITDGAGDCGGNSGITFTTPATKYGRVAGNWSVTSTWSLTSGGSAGTTVPLPQDNVVLDANSGAGTYTMNMMRHGKDIVCTGFTATLSMAASGTQRYIFGSLTLSSGMTLSVSPNLTLAGRGSHTITMAGQVFPTVASRVITIGRFGGTYTLLDNANFGATTANTGTGITTVGGVTFSANGFNVTAPRIILAASTVNMGSGTWNITGTADATPWSAAGTTLNAGTSNIVFANASVTARTFAGSGKAYNDLTYTVAGSTGGLDITGANTFHDLNFSDATNARTLRFTAATTTTFTGAFNVKGTAGNRMTVSSITAANHTLSKASGTVAVDYLTIARSQATGGAAWYAGANSVDGLNNTGWIFAAAPSGDFFAMF